MLSQAVVVRQPLGGEGQGLRGPGALPGDGSSRCRCEQNQQASLFKQVLVLVFTGVSWESQSLYFCCCVSGCVKHPSGSELMRPVC